MFRVPWQRERVGKPLALTPATRAREFTALRPGLDNIRADVWLSPSLTSLLQSYQSELLQKSADEVLNPGNPSRPRGTPPAAPTLQRRPLLKNALQAFLLHALQGSQADANYEIGLLAHVALVQDIWDRFQGQMAEMLRQAREVVHSAETATRVDRKICADARHRLEALVTSRSSILRRAGDEMFYLLREIEAEGLSRTRLALLGQEAVEAFRPLETRLLFCEPMDSGLLSENYVLFGDSEQDRDRYENVHATAFEFLTNINGNAMTDAPELREQIRLQLANPENVSVIFGNDTPDAEQQQRAEYWLQLLRKEEIFWLAAASYETAALIRQYPPLTSNQIRYALVNRKEMERLSELLQRNSLSSEPLSQATRRLRQMPDEQRVQLAVRYFRDFCRFTREMDLRQQVVKLGRRINVVVKQQVRELSAINNSLYEFLLPNEQQLQRPQTISHVVLKADLRSSTELTRVMVERGLNPASHFSRNFFEPLSQVLEQFGAEKVFIEGDAIILAINEQEGRPGPIVSRCCALGRQLLYLVDQQNDRSRQHNLPPLELGIGIAFASASPQYLVDGAARIMISPALNASARLSSCSPRAKRMLNGLPSEFRIFVLDNPEEPEEPFAFNAGGIRLDAAAFERVQKEIAWSTVEVTACLPWAQTPDRFVLMYGQAPLANGTLIPLLLRSAQSVHLRDLKLQSQGPHTYYELCTASKLYQQIETGKRSQNSAAATSASQ